MSCRLVGGDPAARGSLPVVGGVPELLPTALLLPEVAVASPRLTMSPSPSIVVADEFPAAEAVPVVTEALPSLWFIPDAMFVAMPPPEVPCELVAVFPEALPTARFVPEVAVAVPRLITVASWV